MKRKTLGIAVAVALGAMSTAALAVSPYGNGTQKGSLQIFAKVTPNTVIQLTNDFTGAGTDDGSVLVKCYYQTNEQAWGIDRSNKDPLKWAPFPNNYRVKHHTDFLFPMTRNQTIWWHVGSGRGTAGGIPVLFPMADGYAPNTGFNGFLDKGQVEAADLKCWAVDGNGQEIHFNHLVGTATVYEGSDAFMYNAMSFQAVTPSNATENTRRVLPTPGVLNLDGVEYDSCSRQAIGNIYAVTDPWPKGRVISTELVSPDSVEGRWAAQVDLVQCTQDLRETYVPPITKYVFEFWNENENKFTGTEVCGDSWIEIDLWNLEHAKRSNLKTAAAYFRASAVGQICKDAKDGGVMGVISQRTSNGALVGATLNGRGNYTGGKIYYDVGPYGGGGGGDEVKK
jgi:hypothetical protein